MEIGPTRRSFLALTGTAAIGSIAGCAGGGDESGDGTTDAPSPTELEGVLASADTINAWIEAGHVNSEPGDAERVVILRAGDIDSYEDGHLPGAIPWETHAEERVEALTPVNPMVPTGQTMDALFQNAGLNENATILISGSNPLYAARSYWMLRYWGLPRERIVVMDAGYSTYGDSYSLESGGQPDTPSTEYTVRDLDGLNDDLRYSIGEMIELVDEKNAGNRDDEIVDQRSSPAAKITTATVVPSPDYHGGSNFDSVASWKDADELESLLFEEAGIDKDVPHVTYCNTGYQGSTGFFVMDGILDMDDVAVYDGSFSSQWKHYDAKNDPVPNDAWRVDKNGRTEGHTGSSSLSIDPARNQVLTNVASRDANQIEWADDAYTRGVDVDTSIEGEDGTDGTDGSDEEDENNPMG